MPGLESVLLAVYSEGEGKDLVEVRRLVLQHTWVLNMHQEKKY